MRRRGHNQDRGCPFCGGDINSVDYKDMEQLEPFVDDDGRIRSRRRTRTCARHQRMITHSIKRARHVALLPFTGEHRRRG